MKEENAATSKTFAISAEMILIVLDKVFFEWSFGLVSPQSHKPDKKLEKRSYQRVAASSSSIEGVVTRSRMCFSSCKRQISAVAPSDTAACVAGESSNHGEAFFLPPPSPLLKCFLRDLSQTDAYSKSRLAPNSCFGPAAPTRPTPTGRRAMTLTLEWPFQFSEGTLIIWMRPRRRSLALSAAINAEDESHYAEG